MKIEISDSLAKRLEQYRQETTFKEINDLVAFMLDAQLKSTQSETENKVHDDVNQRLKDLGYI